ncbi:MAG TPA: gliding motility-associated C-terminal domain-containing protein, partial [Bacteroidales bacterium]|nr:gliding motility-associated C-terminal domain-containing protein [Bacteroidales bacterium]
ITTITYNTTGATGATINGLPAGVTGNWSMNTITISGTATATGTFNYTISLNGGCGTITSAGTLTINPNVTPTFTAVGPICVGDVLSPLPTTSNNSITGSWSPQINNTDTTTYTFTPTTGLCALTTTMTIIVNPIVVPVFTAIAPICAGDNLLPLPTTSTNGITGTWDPPLNNTTTTIYTFTPTPGICASSASITVTVYPVFNTNNPQTICFGQSYTINSHTYTTTGTYIDTLSSVHGCDSLITTNLLVNPLPVITFNPDPALVCLGDSLSILANGALSYSWSPDEGLNTTSGNYVIANPSTTTVYTVVGADGNNCISTANLQVVVAPIPVVDITTENPTICPGNFINLYATPGFSNYYWTEGGDNDYTSVDHGGLFFVQVWDSHNCTSYDSIFIEEECQTTIYIPNTFTPNGDGMNDGFSVIGENIEALEIWIYNRWGQVIFYSDDVNFAWDGTFKGSPVPQGVYTYYLEYESYYAKMITNLQSRTGIINIIR